MKVADLDELLGTPARLAILATLAGEAEVAAGDQGHRWTFTALREETGLADGNLHVQARKLTMAGYLHSDRARLGNRLVTCFELTESGRRALRGLQRQLRAALDRAATGAGSGPEPWPAIRKPAGPGPTACKRTTPGDDSRVW